MCPISKKKTPPITWGRPSPVWVPYGRLNPSRCVRSFFETFSNHEPTTKKERSSDARTTSTEKSEMFLMSALNKATYAYTWQARMYIVANQPIIKKVPCNNLVISGSHLTKGVKFLHILYHHLCLCVNSKRSLPPAGGRLLLLLLFKVELVSHPAHIPHSLHTSRTFLLFLWLICNGSFCCKEY